MAGTQKAPRAGANNVLLYDPTDDTAAVATLDTSTQEAITGHPVLVTGIQLALTQHRDDAEYETLLKNWLNPTPPEMIEVEYSNEDKIDILSAADVAKKLIMVWHGGKHAGKRKTIANLVYLTGNTGDQSYGPKKLPDSPITLQSLKADKEYTIAASQFNAALVTATDAVTLATDSHGAFALLDAV